MTRGRTPKTGRTVEQLMKEAKISRAEAEAKVALEKEAEDLARKITVEDCPSYFTELQHTIFVNTVELFETLPVNIQDLAAVIRFCVMYSVFIDATLAVNEYGVLIDGKRNPAVAMATEASRELKSLEAQLSLNPTARIRLLGEQNKAEEEADPFEQLFNEGQEG